MIRTACFAASLLTLLTALAIADEAPPAIKPVETWKGKLQDESLKAKAPESGFIADAKSWKKLWKAWRAGEKVPQIDFAKDLVLVGTAPGPNLAGMSPRLDDQGNVKFIVFSTRIGGPGFGYTLFQMSRDGVKSVNGETVPPAEAAPSQKTSDDSIEVTVFGRLKTGLVAIGGETTGTTITAQGITWELDLSDSPAFAKLAEELDGKRAVVQGSLEHRAGVEVQDRWIVKVTALQGMRE